MRKRNIRIQICLNEKEITKLNKNMQKSGLPRETYIRALINGFSPKETPPIEYHLMMRKLHEIGSGLNQLAELASITRSIERDIFEKEADNLRNALLKIQAAVTSPERISNGNNSDMACEKPP